MKKSIRVALSFATFTDDLLNSFAILVLTCLKTNPLFPTPPVTIAILTTLQTAFQDAITAAEQGGPVDTAAKNEARDALIAGLRQIAGYVQTLAVTLTLSQILSSGYDVVINNSTQSPLTQPVLIALDNSMSTELGVSLQPITNAKAYQVQFCIGTAAWQEAGIFPSTRSIVITGLTSGTIYTVRVRAVGGSTQYSNWSATIALMAT